MDIFFGTVSSIPFNLYIPRGENLTLFSLSIDFCHQYLGEVDIKYLSKTPAPLSLGDRVTITGEIVGNKIVKARSIKKRSIFDDCS